MIESNLDIHQSEGHIIVCPNMSSRWKATRMLLWFISVLSISIGVFFALMGLWLILPFAGLEVMTLVTVMYWVAHQCCRQEVIHLDGDKLRVEKGYRTPHSSWESEIFWTRLIVDKPPYQGHPFRIILRGRDEQLEIGEFLNESDKKKLLSELRRLITVVH